jgi:ABC-2 type transport system permease protein
MPYSITGKSLPLLAIFECRYQTRQISFWLLTTIMLAYGLVITIDHMGEGLSQLQSNSPYRLSYFVALTSCLSAIVISLLCVNSFMRDSESGFQHLVGHLNSPKQRQAQLLSILGLAIIIVSLITIGMAFGLLSPNLVSDIGEDKIAVFNLTNYITPWLIFVIPNCVIISLIMSAISIRFQNAFLVYCAVLIFLILFFFAIVIIGAPITGTPVSARESTLIIASLVDPFGAAAFFEQTALMSVQAKNQQSTVLSGWLLANRILWLSAATIIYAICRNKMPKPSQNKPGQSKRSIVQKKVSPREHNIKSENLYSNLSLTSKLTAARSASISLLKDNSGIQKISTPLIFNSHFEVKSLLKNNAFKTAMFLWLVMVLVGISMVDHTFNRAEMVEQFASTPLLISQCAEAFSGMALFFIIYFCSDKLWRASAVKMTGLIESTPVANLVLDCTKLISLFIIPIIMLLTLIAISVLYQIFKASHLIELSTYFSMLLYLVFPLFIKTCTVFFIQSAVLHSRIANKYLAMLLSALFVFGLPLILVSIGVQNPLMLFNKMPDILRSYSEFDGYGLIGQSAKWLILYWGLIAVIISLLAFSLHQRNDELSSSFPNFLNGVNNKVIFGAVLVGVLLTSSAIQNKILDSQYPKSARAQLDSFEKYESSYNEYRSVVHPEIVHTDSEIEHYPSRHSIHVKATSTIKNNSTESIKRILLTSLRKMLAPKIVGAKLIRQKSTGYWHVFEYQFTTPLKQGEVSKLSYSMEIESTPFYINGNIKANGTYLHQGRIEPILGYVSAIEIQDNFQRKKRGLALLGTANTKFRQQTNTVRRTFKTKLITTSNMKALTVGKLSNQGSENGRSFYEYEINQPVYSMISYFFAKYEKQSFSYGSIPIEIYYDKKHGTNILEMARAAKLTIKYMQAEFGAYPYDSLKLIETTRQTPFGGRASAGVVALNESLFTQNPKGKVSINNVVRNTIHEVVHQWFGEKLAAREGAGQKIIHESITKYLEAEILAIAESQEMADELMAYNFRRYLSGRSYAHKKEVPLSETQNENYLSYGKGPVVFKAIKELIGREKLHQALRILIENNLIGTDATFDDMLSLIIARTPDNEKNRVRYWLTQVFDLQRIFIKKDQT